MGPHTGSVAQSSHSTDWRQTNRDDYLRAIAGNEYHNANLRSGSRHANSAYYDNRSREPLNSQGNGTTSQEQALKTVEELCPQSGSSTHIPQKNKESRKLTRASLMAVTHAPDGRSISPVNSASYHSSKTMIRPEDSVSVVCGVNVARQDIVAVNVTTSEEMTESSGADWKRNLSKRFATANGFSNYIASWISRIPVNIAVPQFDGNGERMHWQCAVDPASCKLLDPVPYPETLRDERPLDDGKARWRRRTGTSNSACKEYTIQHGDQQEDDRGNGDVVDLEHENVSIVKIGTISNTNLERGTEQAAVSKTANVSPASPALPHNTAITTFKHASPVYSTSCPPGPVCPREVCYYIRPAEETDMIGVQEIYNLEVLKGTQAMDAEPLDIEDFFSILTTCRKAMLPFLVVIDEQNKTEGTREGVLGFGFLSIYQPGLAGGLSGTSRYSVKVNVFVHPNHRQKGVGSTILGKLLQLCSFNYSPKKEYGARYTHSDDTGLYNSCRGSPRQYHQVFAEILYGSERGIAEMWYGRVLTNDFGFQPLGKSIMGAHWSSVGQCWLGKLVFQHDCYAENVLEDDVNVADGVAQAENTSTTGDHIEAHGKANEEEEAEGSPPSRSADASEPVSSQANGGVMLSGNTKDSEAPYW